MKFMKRIFTGFIIFMVFLLGPLAAAGLAEDMTLGERLERQMWTDIKDHDWKAVEKKIATGFQSVHQDGARDRNAEIALIKSLRLGNYALSNFKVTEQGPVIVVTYFISVEETIDGKRLSSAPATRLSLWSKTDNQWQWIAHANLKALGDTIKK